MICPATAGGMAKLGSDFNAPDKFFCSSRRTSATTAVSYTPLRRRRGGVLLPMTGAVVV